jgi:CrcB protein
MRHLAESLWIAFGAALGANARYWIGVLLKAPLQNFPWPTLLINCIGSLLLGAFTATALLKGWGPGSAVRLFFAVGICGGFTTFSTFSFEVLDQFFEKSWKPATIYAVMSCLLCVLFCLAGAHLARIALGSPSSRPFDKVSGS